MSKMLFDLTETFAGNSREAWEALLIDSKGSPTEPRAVANALAKITKTTLDGIEIEPLYSRSSNATEYAPALARRNAESATPWDIRQIIRTPDPAVANEAILQELQSGATSIHLLPQRTTSNYGIALRTAQDIETLLDSVYLDLISVGFEPGATPAEALEWLVNLASNRGIDAAKLSVACNIDPLVDSVVSGLHDITDVADATAELVRLSNRFATDYPQIRTAAADTRPWHNLGANTVQELGIACATGVHHLKALLSAGMDLTTARKQIVFHFAVDTEFFTGVAKLRAMRELWAYICQQFTNDEGHNLPGNGNDHEHAYIHAHTSQRMLSRLDADNNQLRNTLACSAAAIGGADCISVEAHHSSMLQDYPLQQPDEFARRVARNIQMVLLEESNLHRVADPLGGSPYMESLTSELVATGWQIFQQIEQEGGMPAAIQSGSIAQRISDTGQKRLHQLATRQSPIVGVSEFASLEQQAFEQGSDESSLWRTSTAFEKLRIASWQYEKQNEQKPAVLILNLGAGSDYRGRAGFSSNLFAAAGISCIESGLAQPDQIDSVFLEKLKADLISASSGVVTVCSSDKNYEQLDASFFAHLRAAGATRIVLAGRSKTLVEKDLCDDEIYLGCNALEKLSAIQASLGIAPASNHAVTGENSAGKNGSRS